MTSLFLSYARNDDEPFVRRLYADLTAAGFDVWFDRVSMPSRRATGCCRWWGRRPPQPAMSRRSGALPTSRQTTPTS